MLCLDSINQFAAGDIPLDICRQRYASDKFGILTFDPEAKELNWFSSESENKIWKLYCETNPLDAIIVSFPASIYDSNNNETCIAVLISSDLLRLHSIKGQVFDIHLPVKMTKLFSANNIGLVLQRKALEIESTIAANTLDLFL